MKGFHKFLVTSATVALTVSPAVAQVASPTADTAQTSEADPISGGEQADDEIVVTGRVGALNRSIALKREQTSIVDAVTAEDVGKFPDTNIAESLQRITGVEITRDSNGEGQYVSVRGLPTDFSLVTFNGLTVSTVTAQPPNISYFQRSRSFDFSILSPAFISSLLVYKSVSAELDEGGISSNVDVQTLTPFGVGRQRIVLSGKLQGTTGMSDSSYQPNITALYSNVFADDTFGLTVGVDWNRRFIPTEDFQNVTWGAFCTNPTDPTNANTQCDGGKRHLNYQQIIVENTPTTLDTKSAYLSAQFKPAENTLITLNGLYARRKKEQSGGVFIEVPAAPWGSNTYSGPTDDFIVDENNVLTSQANAANWFVNRSIVSDTKDTIGNLTLEVASTFGLWDVDVKGAYSKSKTGSDSFLPQMGAATYYVPSLETIGGYKFFPGEDVPGFIFDPNFDYSDPNQWGDDAMTYSGIDSTHELKSGQFDIKRNFESSFIKSIKFGGKYIDQTVDTTVFNYYHDLVKARGEGVDISFVPAVTRNKGSENILGSYNGPGDRLEDMFFINPQEFIGKYYGGSVDNLVNSAYTHNQTAGGISTIGEKITSAYAQLDFDFKESFPLRGNIGVRYQRTKQKITDLGTDLSKVIYDPNCGARSCLLIRPPITDLTENSSYSKFLPSLNLIADLTDNLTARFSFSKSMARPTLSSMLPSPSIDPEGTKITQGNARLAPFLSTNYDASIEWYFMPSAVVSVAFYNKDMKNFIQNVTTNHMIETVGLPGGTAFQLTQPVNASKGYVRGIEMDYRQSFKFLPGALSGLGVGANLTYSDGKLKAFQRPGEGDIEDINVPESPFQGLTKLTYNLSIFYEKYGFSGVVTLNHRDKYLTEIGVTPKGLPVYADTPMYVYTKGRNQLDVQLSYTFSDRYKIFFEGTNLTKAPFVRYSQIRGVDTKYPQAWFQNGTRLAFGAAVTF